MAEKSYPPAYTSAPPSQPLGFDPPTSPPGWSPPQPQPHYVTQPGVTVVQPAAIVTTATVVPGVGIAMTTTPPMGTRPQQLTCKSCKAEVITTIRYKSATKTHLFALCLCCIGFVLCAWIPYCMKSCKNIDHYCPNCQTYIGSYLF